MTHEVEGEIAMSGEFPYVGKCGECKKHKPRVPEHSYERNGKINIYGICTDDEANWDSCKEGPGRWSAGECNFAGWQLHFEEK